MEFIAFLERYEKIVPKLKGKTYVNLSVGELIDLQPESRQTLKLRTSSYFFKPFPPPSPSFCCDNDLIATAVMLTHPMLLLLPNLFTPYTYPVTTASIFIVVRSEGASERNDNILDET